MKFWEFWKEWGSNVWANKYSKKLIQYFLLAVTLIGMLILEQITGCSFTDY
mgnify:FL=1